MNTQNNDQEQVKMGPLPGDAAESTTSLPPLGTAPSMETSSSVIPQDISQKKLNPKIAIGALALLAFLVVGGVVALQSSGSFLAENRDDRSKAGCSCDGGAACGATRCRNNGEFMDLCQNGQWTAAPSNTCPRTVVQTQAPPPPPPPQNNNNTTQSGGGGGSSDGRDDCTDKNCGAGTCFTGPNPRDGGWGCNCSNGQTLGPSTNPGVCPYPQTNAACSNGQTRCRDGQYNDVCVNGQWTAGGNACTPTTGGGAPAQGCVGGVSCPISYCNSGQDVAPDPCYRGGSCADRTRAACAVHGGAQGGIGGTNISTGGTTAGGGGSGATASTYTPGARAGTGTIGDACVTTADCGKSGNVQLGCNNCGAAIGYKCTAPGAAAAVGCAQPGSNPTPVSGCEGLGAFQIRCLNDGSYRGQMCVLNRNAQGVATGGWSLQTVVADACGATCANGGIQQSSNADRCSGTGPTAYVVGSGFLGCGNVVAGGNGDQCSNCYRISGAVSCQREGSSCGARVECQTRTTAPVTTAPATTQTGRTTATEVSTTTTTITTTPGGMCSAVKLWVKSEDNEWVNLPFAQAPGKVKAGDVVRLSTVGSGRVFTQGRFRIKVDEGAFGGWQTTTVKDKGEFYINYTIPSLSKFTVESQVF